MSYAKSTPSSRKPLRISCTSSDCGNNLHCFRKSRKMAEVERGRCRSCGADLIDWPRVHKRDLNDAAFVFSSLKVELVRHHFWHVPIDLKAENHARRKGTMRLHEAAKLRLSKYLAPNNPRDGRQTPYEGNVIYFAQHALGCCCRACLEYWHDIPKKNKLSDDELEYLTNLIMMYVKEKLPNLTEEGETVPPMRS